jgi:hypothetical protein
MWPSHKPPKTEAPRPQGTVPVSEPAAAPDSVAPAPEKPAPTPSSSAERLAARPVPDANPLNERTLIGTKWEREGFGFEFGPDGKLLIGGRERAKWRVEGGRIRLYRDTTGEEHWLDIVGNKLMWEGQEIGRVR